MARSAPPDRPPQRSLPDRLRSSLPSGAPPPVVAGLAIGIVVLLIATCTSWTSAGRARRDAREATQQAEIADVRASDLARELADLRSQLQGRQGEVEDLAEEVEGLSSELDEAQGGAAAAIASASEAAAAEASAAEDAAAATTLARVTAAIAENDDVIRALHITDVVDADTLVGFDLREMLADGPDAGQAVQLSLAVTDAPAEGDCRHTQSVALATAWLEATDHDVLLRRPPEAPQTDALGRQLVEVIAFTNPDSSLNVTLAVAGEAVIDEDTAATHPGLTERLRVAQASAQSQAQGVWGCQRSELLGVGTDDPSASPSPSPSGSPTPGPTPTS